jgi:hypothetical protein
MPGELATNREAQSDAWRAEAEQHEGRTARRFMPSRGTGTALVRVPGPGRDA